MQVLFLRFPCRALYHSRGDFSVLKKTIDFATSIKKLFDKPMHGTQMCLECSYAATFRSGLFKEVSTMKSKAITRQLARTAGGQDLWPRKSVAHELRAGGAKPQWAREFIRRRLGNALATPVNRLP
jgi:hypothetical protein